MREEAIPFGKREVGIDTAKDGNKVVLESSNGLFGCIGAMLFGRDALEVDIVFLEGLFEVLGAFVVKDVQGWGMTMLKKLLVCGFPGVADACCFAIGNGAGMDGVGILVI